MPEPWICPRCGHVNHPSSRRCDCGFAPKGDAQPPPAYAGFWIRVLADTIDGLMALALALPVWFLFDRPVLGATSFLRPDSWRDFGLSGGILWFMILWNMTWLVSRTGQSLGRKIVGIVVTDVRTGLPPGFLRAFSRNLFAGFISSIFYLGFLWLVVDRRKQTWHDKLFGTIVTYAEEGPGRLRGRAGRGRPWRPFGMST